LDRIILNQTIITIDCYDFGHAANCRLEKIQFHKTPRQHVTCPTYII